MKNTIQMVIGVMGAVTLCILTLALYKVGFDQGYRIAVNTIALTGRMNTSTIAKSNTARENRLPEIASVFEDN